jgi:hypothetical protein
MNESDKTPRTPADWETIIGQMEEKRISDLNADGQMTDAVLERVSQLEYVTVLNLTDRNDSQMQVSGTWHACRSCSSST